MGALKFICEALALPLIWFTVYAWLTIIEAMIR